MLKWILCIDSPFFEVKENDSKDTPHHKSWKKEEKILVTSVIYKSKHLTSLKALKEKVHKDVKQAGAELCQAQVELEVVVEVGVEFWVEVEACHY